MQQILIRGGRVIDPASGFDDTADVLLADGVIAEVSTTRSSATTGDNVTCIDAEGCIVSPGLIDPHVHLREPDSTHEETIRSGLASAVNGGFTTVCCMPNTRPALDRVRILELVRYKAQLAGTGRVFPVGCVSVERAGERLAPIGAMARAGAVAFTDDGAAVADAGLMLRALQTVKGTGRCIMQHCEEPSLTRGSSINSGVTGTRLGLKGWPAVAEEMIIERDVRLNREIGCRYHAQHLSSGGSVDIIRRARAEGLPVTAEVSPHHLLLTEEACNGYNTMAKMNPPLRTRADIDELIKGVADGTLTVLATDHAPHPLATKSVEFDRASFGIVSLDCALPLYARALIEPGVLDWPALLAMITINAARLVGLDRIGLGMLAEGGPADVTVIDPQLRWTIRVAEFAGTGRNCPFDGWEVKGRAIATIVGGRMVAGARDRGSAAPMARERTTASP